MDMTGGYAKSVLEHAPQATIVIDNYHVVQLATKALDEVRREHWNELRHAGETGAAKQFKHDRWSLLKNPDDLSDQQAATLAAIRAGGGKHRTRLGDEGDGPRDLRPGPHRQRGQRTARPAAVPPSRCRLKPFIRLGTHDPQAPRGHPRRPTDEAQQRPRRVAQQPGETDRPTRVRVPLRPSRACAHSPRLRTGHPHPPTRTLVRVTSPTIMPGEPKSRVRGPRGPLFLLERTPFVLGRAEAQPPRFAARASCAAPVTNDRRNPTTQRERVAARQAARPRNLPICRPLHISPTKFIRSCRRAVGTGARRR